MIEIVAALAQALLLALVYLLLGWLFPPAPEDPAQALSPARRQAMRRAYGLGNLAVLALMLPSGWLALRVLQSLARAWHGPAEHALIAGWIFWALPALFLGILVAGFLVEGVLRLRLGEAGYRDLHVVMGEQLGADPTRAGVAVCGVLLVVVAGLVGVFLELHLVLDGDRLRLDWPFHDAVEVPVSAVRWVREYRPGRYPEGDRVRVVEHPHFRLAYGPGEDDWWKSSEFHGPGGISPEVRAAMEDLARRAGREIQRPTPREPGARE